MHIEDKELKRFQQGEIEPETIRSLFEHIETCDYCADRLMDIKAEEQIKAPEYLKENMIKRTQMFDVKAEMQLKVTSKKVQLLLYGLKTTAAVLGALLILCSVGNTQTTDYIKNINDIKTRNNLSYQLQEKSNYVLDIMDDITNQIVNGGMHR